MIAKHEEMKVEDLGGGVNRRVLAYAPNMMAAEISFETGAVGAPHSHPHEQIGYVISGSIEYKQEGAEKVVLKAGDTYYVEPNAVHGVVALEPTVLLDVFTPMREEFIKNR